MPEPAAELTLDCYGQAQERAETANELLRTKGFHSSDIDGAMMELEEYTLFQYEPFENRDANLELLDECVEALQNEFPEMEVWLRSKPNKDYGNPVSEDHLLYIAPDRDVVA